MIDPLAWLDDELAALDAQHLRRTLVAHQGAQGAEIEVPETPTLTAARRTSQCLVNFGSNDYLGLAADPRLIEAAMHIAAAEGWGAGASPLVTGRSTAHAVLEQRLADFEGTEAALAFTSGFAANAGAVAALVERGDAIFADAKNHASLIDGCRLSRADVHIYRHADIDHLAELLTAAKSYRRRLIVTDTLFSMDGDFAPLEKIAELAEQYGTMLLVDEAHATGVFGQRGRGLSEQLHVENGVHIRIGTLSKALGGAGGFVAGRRSLIDWLANRARSYVFSTASPPAVAGAAIAAIKIVQAEAFRREQLRATATELRNNLEQQGWNIGKSTSQIVPIYLGAPERTLQIAERLKSEGLWVPGIRPPSVPVGQSLLRISLNWSHTPEMLHKLTASLANEARLQAS